MFSNPFSNLPIEQAKLQVPLYLWEFSIWSLWINRYTYRFRLICVAVALKFNCTPPMDLSQTFVSEEEHIS